MEKDEYEKMKKKAEGRIPPLQECIHLQALITGMLVKMTEGKKVVKLRRIWVAVDKVLKER